MGEALEAAAAALRERLAVEGERGLDGAARFEIEDTGVLRVAGIEVTTGSVAAEGEADVVISASFDTFRDVFEGALSPATAFMTGRMRIEGDMSTALRLGQIIG